MYKKKFAQHFTFVSRLSLYFSKTSSDPPGAATIQGGEYQGISAFSSGMDDSHGKILSNTSCPVLPMGEITINYDSEVSFFHYFSIVIAFTGSHRNVSG